MPLGTSLIGRAIAQRCKRGLYAGKQIQFGNRVSEDGGNRTKRKWLPNAHRKRLFSEKLNSFVSFQVTAAALRNIDKAGGLDNYVRKIKGTREDSQGALNIRIRLGEDLSPKDEQAAQKQKERKERVLNEQRKRSLTQHHRSAQLEAARLRNQRPDLQTASQAESKQSSDSTLGWIKNKIGGGFKWQ